MSKEKDKFDNIEKDDSEIENTTPERAVGDVEAQLSDVFDRMDEKNTCGDAKVRSGKMSISTFIFAAVALILAAVMLTYSCCSSFYKKEIAKVKLQNTMVGALGEYQPLYLIDSLFDIYSYYETDEKTIVESVLRAYVESTGDLYAEYYNENEYKALQDQNVGLSEGIGINIIYSQTLINGRNVKVIEVISISPGSPAEEAGMKVGDLIAWCGIGDDAKQVDTIGYTAAMSELRGAKDTNAEFIAMREKGDGTYETLTYSIERRVIETTSVYHSVSETDSKVGIVKISQFDLTVPKQFSAAMDSLIKAGCDKFVFDVRYNPGGDLQSIVAVLNYFLDEGDVILSTKDKSGEAKVIYAGPVSHEDEYASCNVSARDVGKYKGYEMVVLCNNGTASAAELFTAAMRDYELADIVGQKTYGKGSMQSIIPLSHFGYKGALRLTTKMYFPPCGEGYDGLGIEPDVVSELGEEAKKYNIYVLPQSIDDQLQAALKLF